MSDRDYVHPEVIEALEELKDIEERHSAHIVHDPARMPLLTPRASGVLAAVETAMKRCDVYACDKVCGVGSDDHPAAFGCALSSIRGAWKAEVK